MLDSKARKVLKYFLKTKTEQDTYTIACNVKLSKDENKLVDLVEVALEDLIENSYIKLCHRNTQGNTYVLTSLGKTYFKNEISKWTQSVLNGIVFPIIVALLTSLITTMLTIYLSKYQQDTQHIEIDCNCKNDKRTN